MNIKNKRVIIQLTNNPIPLPNDIWITCKSYEDLKKHLTFHPNSIILYTITNPEIDFKTIKHIRKKNYTAEFILITNTYNIETHKKLTTLGIFSIYHYSIHPKILELDIIEINNTQKTHQETLEQRANQVLDTDIYISYKNIIQSQSPKHILIIEDDKQLRNKISQHLIRKSYICYDTDNIQTALAYSQDHKIDTIILDLELPDTTGDSHIKALSKAAPNAAIIILTAYKEYELLTKCINLGAHDFITKPFIPTTLTDSIIGSHGLIKLKEKY